MAKTRQAIIMSGFDYQGGGVNFAEMADHRRALLIAKDPQMTVTLMDVAAGTTSVSAMAAGTGAKARRKVTTTATHKPVTSANYTKGLKKEGSRFDKDQAGRMSIMDLYAAVQAIGADKATKGTLIEVSVISHGFFVGPILVDSDDNASGPARDPDDKDARVKKDFTPPNSSGQTIIAFRAAFAEGARWWNWGCAFTESYRQVTDRLVKSPLYRRTPRGKLKDTDKITLSFDQLTADDIYGHDVFFFPTDRLPPRKPKSKKDHVPVFKVLSFECTVKQIKDFFMRGVGRCYHKAVAKAGNVTVIGAFLGTYADYEQHDKRIRLPVMEIPRDATIFKDDFRSYIGVWTDVLGFAVDPEGHGYGVFPP